MLYYYRPKKKSIINGRQIFFSASLALLLVSYLSPSSIQSVVKESSPTSSTTVTEFHTNLIPGTPLTTPRTANTKLANGAVNMIAIRKARQEFQIEGKTREARELGYSLDLLTKIKRNDPEAKQRSAIIKQDIAKTVGFFAAGNTTSERAQILGQYDGGHLAYVYYPNYGVHFNPVTTANVAIEQYEKGNKSQVIAIADELLKNAIKKEYPGVGPYYIWENYFDLEFGQYRFPAPWRSGMAQGLVLDVIGKAYELSGDKKFRFHGDLILNSFRIPWNEGGVTAYDQHGNEYLEVATTDKIRILNGFLFTLDSLHNYYEATGNKKALNLFNAGVNEAKSHLAQYDLGYWSNYSLVTGNRANYGYHKIHVDLLKRLYDITDIAEFKEYSDKFEFYRKFRFIDIPPKHRSFKQIAWLSEHGVFKSTDGWFSCFSDVTRGEFVSWLTTLEQWKPTMQYKGYYNDVRRDQECWPYIEAAYDQGLRLADSDGNFNPNEKINRAEIALILYGVYACSPDEPIIPIKDNKSGSEHTQDAIQLVVNNELMDLYEGNYFRAEININREQAALILYKLAEGTVPLRKQINLARR